MFLFDISDTTQVNLENIDAVKIVGGKNKGLAVVISGQTYVVDINRHKELISTIDRIQRSVELTRQYHAV
jgi:hypothetical protein